MSNMTRARLRAMKARWQRDSDALEAAFPITDWLRSDPELETIRNLESAIAWIDGIITSPEPLKGRMERRLKAEADLDAAARSGSRG